MSDLNASSSKQLTPIVLFLCSRNGGKAHSRSSPPAPLVQCAEHVYPSCHIVGSWGAETRPVSQDAAQGPST